MGQAKTLIVVPHTHWDREWYRPYQDFRSRLVQTVDRILDLMDSDPEYSHFSLDGQTVVLEDYLEIRPEQRERLERLIRAGRVLIGPWYVLPDEFLVSGEAIIRNLLRGDRVAAGFGAKMPVGYLPDQFGHIAQMPQILRGAGLDTATLWRGVPAAVKQAEFEWQAPDGSQVFCVYLPQGYGNAAQLELSPDDLKDRLRRIMHDLEPFQVTEYHLLMNGSDHLPAQPGLPQALAGVAGELGASVKIGTLPQYIEAVRREVTAMPRHVGELRSPARAPMLVGCSSTRIGQKQRNHRIETLLTSYAEPFAAWAGVLDGSAPQGFLREAWKLLLHNQPHDSICGCSIDQVHREMETRYDWSEQIARQEIADRRQQLAAHIDTTSLGGNEGLLIWNPTGTPRTDIVTAVLASGQGGKRLELVDPSGSRIPVQSVASEGRDLFSMKLSPLQLRAAMAGIHSREIMGLWCNDYSVSRAGDTAVIQLFFGAAPVGELDVRNVKKEIAALLEDKEIKQFQARAIAAAETTLIFRAADLPAHGWALYRLEEARGDSAAAGVLQASPEGLENDFYRVTVNADGSLSVTDKETGVIYPAVNQFVDGGDRGDEYTYCPPDKDQLISEPQPPKRLGVLTGKIQGRVVEAGPVRATIELSLEYRVPSALAPDRVARGKDNVNIAVTTRISLVRGLKRIDFSTTVDNTARDHRFRVHFAAPYRIDGMSVESQYAVVHRDLDLAAGEDWPELPAGTGPVKTFASISDGQSGLTVINRGIPEYEVLAGDTSATVALTLIRAVGWLSREDLKTRPSGHAGPGLETPEAQCLGKYTFDYALTTHRGNWHEARAWQAGHCFNQPIEAQPVATHSGALPARGSFVETSGDGIVLAAVKPAEDGDGVIVRVYNTTPRTVEGEIKFFRSPSGIAAVDLLERPLDAAVQRDGETSVRMVLPAWRIASYRCRF